MMLRRSIAGLCVLTLLAWPVSGLTPAALVAAEVAEPTAGQWSGGAGLGFLGSTPDGVLEFGFNGHADYFVINHVSLGPLVQYAGVGNDMIFGLSAQAKYWWDIPGSHRARIVVQGGVGFVRAGIEDADSGVTDTSTSFLIPLGIGLDYALSQRFAVTADVLLNVTSLGQTLRAGGRDVDLHTNLMPGLYLGVRF